MTDQEVVQYIQVNPVPQAWIDENRGKWVSIHFTVTLNDLLNANGIGDLNELCDEITGVVLTDITYRVAGRHSSEEVVLEAIGIVEDI